MTTSDATRSWHYAAAVELVSGQEQWSVAEVYVDQDGAIDGYVSPAAPHAWTLSELEADLGMMIEDVKRHVLDLTGDAPVLRERTN